MTTKEYKKYRATLHQKQKPKKPRRHSLVRQSLRERLMNDWVERRIANAAELHEVMTS